MSTKDEADKLRDEAKELLQKLFKVPEGFSNTGIDRLVDCIVGAAVLETASILEQSTSDKGSH